jgi:hypothetical protein
MRRFFIAAALWLDARAAHAAERNPLELPIRDQALVLIMTLLGGFVGWYAKVKKGEVSGASLFALVGEMTTSALAGLGAFLVCDYLNVPIGPTGAISGLCGYMGGRVIEMAERWLQARIDARMGSKP